MSIVFLAKGTATMGMTKTDKDGNVASQTPAQFSFVGTGGCVAVGELDPETLRPKEPITELYGDWDAASYLSKALELIKPTRPDNIPDFKGIMQSAMKDNIDFCDYCPNAGYNCRDCIIRDWEEEVRE